MVLVKGVDAEIIAMGLSKVGIIYHCLLKNTIRAKEVFNESINLTSAMTEHGKLYSNPWYVLYVFINLIRLLFRLHLAAGNPISP